MNEVIKKNGLNYGVIVGILMILITATMYAIDLKLFVNNWIGAVNFIIIITLGCISVSKSKKALGGFMSFKEAFSGFFICVAVGIGIQILFNTLLFNLIDPSAKETITEHMIEYTVNLMKGFGVPTDALKKAVEEIEKTDSFGPIGQLKAYFWQVLVYSLIGLIVALIFRNKTSQQE
jgi:selenophosphate synthase